jgi:hypothetical protein
MVAVSSPAKVLVTGANGYLAVWTVKKYLEAGYSVRGTVRSLTRSAFLKEQFAEYGERLELVVVEDITKDGAFDEAVRGVDAIAHTASPFHYNAIEPDGASQSHNRNYICAAFNVTLPHRAHRTCRTGYHDDPKLCTEARHEREADRAHVVLSCDPRGRPQPTHVRRDELEQCRRHSGED